MVSKNCVNCVINVSEMFLTILYLYSSDSTSPPPLPLPCVFSLVSANTLLPSSPLQFTPQITILCMLVVAAVPSGILRLCICLSWWVCICEGQCKVYSCLFAKCGVLSSSLLWFLTHSYLLPWEAFLERVQLSTVGLTFLSIPCAITTASSPFTWVVRGSGAGHFFQFFLLVRVVWLKPIKFTQQLNRIDHFPLLSLSKLSNFPVSHLVLGFWSPEDSCTRPLAGRPCQKGFSPLDRLSRWQNWRLRSWGFCPAREQWRGRRKRRWEVEWRGGEGQCRRGMVRVFHPDWGTGAFVYYDVKECEII